MKRLLPIFLLILFFILACSEAPAEETAPVEVVEDSVVEEAAPTAEPEPEPTSAPEPTSEPEPTAVPPNPLYTGTAGSPWWNDAVFYEIFVRSFYDSDGDGIGDLNGLIEKLDYINDGDPSTTSDLGATGIWLMPIAVSPSYHGYDVVDYFTVNPEYGTNDDFKRLMEEAHARGIRIVVDLVLNHTSVEHPWFIESTDPDSERRDWYIWAEENPGFRGPDGQVVWHNHPSGYYYGVFWGGMPDLNVANPEVTEAMYEAAAFWLEEMGADGFRLDAIKHMIEEGQAQENTFATHDWLEEFYVFTKEVAPDAFLVGEAWTNTQQVLEYTGDEVDIAFQFDLALDILNVSDAGIAQIFTKTMLEVYENFPSNQYATFITNHDQNRVMSQLDEDTGKAGVAASILLTAPGVPFIYYGEEIGQTGTKPDEDIRRPMQWNSDSTGVGFTTGLPWRAPSADYTERSVALQENDPASLLNHYRALIHLRNEHAALRVGDWTMVEANSARLYTFLRHFEDEVILVVINVNRNPVEAADYSLELAAGPLDGEATAVSLYGAAPDGAPEVNADGGFSGYIPFAEIPPQSTHIIQLSP